ncbi:MAG: dephospho-CoA kinase [Flavobacteriia bacterium]|nr:dephospho-CoA kinase [Flavobacteriia bacterium]
MLNVGLTGGIGSGKSTVAQIFEAFGIPCYYADDRAKELMRSDENLKSDLIEEFGADVYQDGSLNRSLLAKIIFEDDSARERINGLVHPAVGRDYEEWQANQNSAYVLKEAAILFETGGYKASDYNILVTAPEELRLRRVMERDGAKKEEVLARMRAQWSDEKKSKLADFIILNDEDHSLITQVKEIHEALLIRANSSN